ncbi:predicted protein [Naegleria gruberi]|uniref:Predicted protein n=1 Tax=Naegleria gruberi TaxID=5762 RepID=D2VT44_NAEGR|nr:uncharacterized protein NAEGRDRAFT_72168 [Naegleria gruberi]EFC40082.1 predicted protein [Naegleria gruberi]|eukprot:XP_002672826.1 predicted protein [Naegleria gruberi strain NEG-M]
MYFSRLDWRIYPNQENREKKKCGRLRRKSQFNKKKDVHNVENNLPIDRMDFSMNYPKIRVENNYSIVEAPSVNTSPNSIQKQLYRAQMKSLHEFKTKKNIFNNCANYNNGIPQPIYKPPKPETGYRNRMNLLTSKGERTWL